MWRLLLSVLLLSTTVLGQDEPIQLFGFRGLNTIAGDFQLKPVDARKAHDVDFGRQIGCLMPRRGYDSISAMGGMDSLVGLFGAYYSDGTQKLFLVADSDGVGYGNVYVGTEGSADVSSASRIWQYFSIQNKPSFAMLDDNVYMVNGSQKGIVYDGNNARPYPLQVPGEPYIVPLSRSGPLHGEYRYVIRGVKYSGGSSPSILNTVVSSPVMVKNGQILLTRLQLPIADSLYDSIDSGYFRFYRTKANPGPLDLSDTAYRVPGSLGWDAGDISDLVFIDSISDDNLLNIKFLLADISMHGRDSLGVIWHCYGSPTFVSSKDTVYAAGGIFKGWPTKQKDTLGVAYVCAFIDTSTGIESDTGRSLFVFCDGSSSSPSYRQVTINLPKTIDTEDGIVVNLYRACIYQMGHDTTVYPETQLEWKWAYRKDMKWWIDRFIPETTVVLDYYLLGQFGINDTQFIDGTSYDSLSTQRRYVKQTAPPLMSKIFSYENRLFGLQKSGLYYSASVYADTLQSWGAMALTPINPDDGDMGTTAWPARGVIRYMKSYSNHNVYQDANLNWNKTEVSGYFGCIAGRSHAAGLGGHYYLSSEGVLREVEGMALERTQQVSLLSKTLNNFDQYSVIDLSEAEAFYFDRKYLLNLGDTTYVYDERAETWSTWGFVFSSATLYGTEDEVRFLPGDSMYFIKPGSSGLYRFEGSDSDMTVPIEMVWKSGPFLAGPEEKRIYRIGRWISSTDDAGSVGLNITDEEGDSLGSITFSSLTSRYLMKGFGLGPANLFQVEITSSSPGTAVEKLDIWYKVLARKITQ